MSRRSVCWIYYHLRLLFFLSILGAVCLISGCDRSTRYKVITTIFTGVPPYEEYYAEAPVEKEELRATAEEQNNKTNLHPVYAVKDCDSCHNNIASAKSDNNITPDKYTANNKDLPLELVLPVEKLCTATCHRDKAPKRAIRERLWLHNPVAQGKCLECHDPHHSNNPYQLRKHQDGICESCHPKTELVSRHETSLESKMDSVSSCFECHNTHIGADSKMLVREYTEVKQKVMMPQ